MPAFWKNPKFIIGAIVVLWVAYVIGKNFTMEPITIALLPFGVNLRIAVSAAIIGGAIFGSAATIVIQMLWKRWRSSKPSSSAQTTEGRSTSTSA